MVKEFICARHVRVTAMLDVHAPHERAHSWSDFFIHIATIVIGLLIAVGLEQTVEYFHHRHQAREGLALLRREVDANRLILQYDAKVLAFSEREQHANLGVLQRLRNHKLQPNDRLIFIRPVELLESSAWRVVHESAAASYIPHDLMAVYDDIQESQRTVNEDLRLSNNELQRAAAALNSEQTDDSEEADRLQKSTYRAAATPEELLAMTPEAFDAAMARFSGPQDLSRLTPAQIDRLEQGFQQAITDDRRLHRWYLALGNNYEDELVARQKK
jgi:hypothetical protein